MIDSGCTTQSECPNQQNLFTTCLPAGRFTIHYSLLTFHYAASLLHRWVMRFPLRQFILPLVFLLATGSKAFGYSVLTHEAIVDAAWDKSIRPFLLARFPRSTDSVLNKARAYAYGGALAPDMGYYPRGSKFFTNLVHYVRSGDFVQALLDSAKDVNETAFALGALSHYAADRYGHPLGTNVSAPLIYPSVRKKFGTSATYEEDPLSHVRTEFGFDVLQTARGNYASTAFHDFIGFQVSKELLAKAFLKTYGLQIDDVFVDFDKAVSSFRWCVKELFPFITRTAWARKSSDIRKANPGITARKFKYRMNSRIYQNDFGGKDKPGFGASMLSFFIRVIPKVGKLKVLKFKVPGPVAEKFYLQSFDTTVAHYSAFINATAGNALTLTDVDFDTGNKTVPGEYGLADKSYRCLLVNLQKDKYQFLDKKIKADIINFYGMVPEKDKGDLQPVLNDLQSR
jgi:hypothetical protein